MEPAGWEEDVWSGRPVAWVSLHGNCFDEDGCVGWDDDFLVVVENCLSELRGFEEIDYWGIEAKGF